MGSGGTAKLIGCGFEDSSSAPKASGGLVRRQFQRRDIHPNQTRICAAAAIRIRGRSARIEQALQAVDAIDRHAVERNHAVATSIPASAAGLPGTSSRTCTAVALGKSKCRTTRVAIGTVAPDTPI